MENSVRDQIEIVNHMREDKIIIEMTGLTKREDIEVLIVIIREVEIHFKGVLIIKEKMNQEMSSLIEETNLKNIIKKIDKKIAMIIWKDIPKIVLTKKKIINLKTIIKMIIIIKIKIKIHIVIQEDLKKYKVQEIMILILIDIKKVLIIIIKTTKKGIHRKLTIVDQEEMIMKRKVINKIDLLTIDMKEMILDQKEITMIEERLRRNFLMIKILMKTKEIEERKKLEILTNFDIYNFIG